MCGFVGYHSRKFYGNEVIEKMGNSINHRGPNSTGYWKNEYITLCHKRLSIIDLSNLGSQPMVSEDGRYIIAFNGEIYNYLNLKNDLKKNNISFISNTDTEVLLSSFIFYGIDKTLELINGMFAIVFYDTYKNELFLIRDRFGEKPLYYGWSNSNFYFASELIAITKHPEFSKSINSNALYQYFKYSNVPGELSIYDNINKLTPGSYFKINLNNYESQQIIYYNKIEKVKAAFNSRNHKLNNYSDILNENIIKSVKSQMISDVPIGAFLSGGIDSSTIVSIMQSVSNQTINTFTIGINEVDYNEASFAKETSKYLGTNHTELYLNESEIINEIPFISSIHDEPFSDYSQIPTYFVSKLAKRHVSVVLSGDGGDELFSGYNRHFNSFKYQNYLNYTPESLKIILTNIINSKNENEWDSIYKKYYFILKNILKTNQFGQKLYKIKNILNANSSYELYDTLISNHNSIFKQNITNNLIIDNFNDLPYLNISEKIMFNDLMIYLPDDILCKVDRAAMSNSLETRVPFLNHEVVELAWQIPYSYKYKGGIEKWILKEVLYKYMPREMFNRPKSGFTIPLGKWLNNELKEWSRDMLSSSEINKHSFFKKSNVDKIFENHSSGKENNQQIIWSLLMFQSWYNKHHDKS